MGLYHARNTLLPPEERRRRKRETSRRSAERRARWLKLTPAQRRREINAAIRERLAFLKQHAATVTIEEPKSDREAKFLDKLIAQRAKAVRLSRPAGWCPNECLFDGPTAEAVARAGATTRGPVHPLVNAGRQPRRTLQDSDGLGPSQSGIRVIQFSAIHRRGGLPAR